MRIGRGVGDVLDQIPPELCVQCKAARGLCGIDPCPLLQRVQGHLPKIRLRSKDLFGSSPPSLFVGRHGYPDVNVGPMLPPEHLEAPAARHLDDPAHWMDGSSIADIVGLRSSLVRTAHKVDVHAASRPDRITQISQELALATRPVDTEVRLDRIPRFSAASVGDFTAPHGPTAVVERATLAENPRIERAVDRLTSDTDARASTAMTEMYGAGVDQYQMERILSAGMVGREKHRRLVPTRWAITATDDTLGKALIDRVRDLPTVDKPTVHQGEAFGNRFHVLLLPRVWSFELVEVWLKGSFWAREVTPAVDWEDHRGRTAYAANTTGGYYATRLPVLERLVDRRRQATAVVLREITDAYTTPLGVWVVREGCRRALQAKGLEFEDMEAALRHIDRHARWSAWRTHSGLLPQIERQSSLDRFLDG